MFQGLLWLNQMPDLAFALVSLLSRHELSVYAMMLPDRPGKVTSGWSMWFLGGPKTLRWFQVSWGSCLGKSKTSTSSGFLIAYWQSLDLSSSVGLGVGVRLSYGSNLGERLVRRFSAEW